MRNNTFGDVSGLSRFVLMIPAGRGSIQLYHEDQHGRELLTEISRTNWDGIKRAVELEYNLRSKADKFRVAHFGIGENLLNKQYGQELAVLMWAIETETDHEAIATARRNWQCYKPEERWWFYTMVRASNEVFARRGNYTVAEAHNRGWCAAVRAILCETYRER